MKKLGVFALGALSGFLLSEVLFYKELKDIEEELNCEDLEDSVDQVNESQGLADEGDSFYYGASGKGFSFDVDLE